MKLFLWFVVTLNLFGSFAHSAITKNVETVVYQNNQSNQFGILLSIDPALTWNAKELLDAYVQKYNSTRQVPIISDQVRLKIMLHPTGAGTLEINEQTINEIEEQLNNSATRQGMTTSQLLINHILMTRRMSAEIREISLPKIPVKSARNVN